MKTIKHFFAVLCCLFITITAYAAEPQNNLGRSFNYMMSEWQDLRFINNNNGREVWGVTEEGNSFIFTFENGVVVEECMMIESNDGFAENGTMQCCNLFRKQVTVP